MQIWEFHGHQHPDVAYSQSSARYNLGYSFFHLCRTPLASLQASPLRSCPAVFQCGLGPFQSEFHLFLSALSLRAQPLWGEHLQPSLPPFHDLQSGRVSANMAYQFIRIHLTNQNTMNFCRKSLLCKLKESIRKCPFTWNSTFETTEPF